MNGKFRAVERLARPVRPWTGILLAVAAVSGISWADRATGANASLLALYAIPVALVGWRFGRLRGLAMASVAGAGWAAARANSGGSFADLLVWNSLNRFAVFAFVAVASDLLARWSFMADTDALTGLLNRRAFVDRLRKAGARARRLETPLAIAFLDLDDFKAVNDRFGHAAGDATLVRTARALETTIRAGDVAARLGGDEFAAILWRPSPADAERVGRRLLEGIVEALSSSPEAAKASASVGVVYFPTCPSDVRAALAQADEAMYEAKRGGKGRVVFRSASGPG